jgi:Malic enzyme, NAD binding domain
MLYTLHAVRQIEHACHLLVACIHCVPHANTRTPTRTRQVHMEGMILCDVVAAGEPHALIGLSGAGKIWSRDTLQKLSAGCERPLVFPMSNPTSKSECTGTLGRCAHIFLQMPYNLRDDNLMYILRLLHLKACDVIQSAIGARVLCVLCVNMHVSVHSIK